MAETDSLLKRLVSTFILDFATWLLRTQVRAARPLQSALPGTTVQVDQVFQVTLADDREMVFHMEFQGRREGEAEMLLRLLRLRFGPLPMDAVARVQAADPETLLHWSERVLTAATLDEIFAV
jgi:hypothetical protein